MESSDIGLNSEVQLALCFLGIGTTVAIFQLEGDTFRYAQLREMCGRRSLAMEMEVGDDGTAGPSRLGY